VLYETQRLPAVEKEEVIYQLNPIFLSLEKICSQSDDKNRVYSSTEIQVL
jgi:hypothetical protein